MQIDFATSFKKDYKKHGFNLGLTENWIEVIYLLLRQKPLPEKFRDHALTGDMKDYRECHIKPNLLLVYQYEPDVLKLLRINSHSEIFSNY